MDLEASQLGQDEVLGSWHPAMRPTLHFATNEYNQQTEESKTNHSLAETKAAESITSQGPADVPFTFPPHNSFSSPKDDRQQDLGQRDTPLDLINLPHAISVSNDVLKSGDGEFSQEGVRLGLHTSDGKKLAEPASPGCLSIGSQADGRNQIDGSHALNSTRKTDRGLEGMLPAQSVLNDKEGNNELDIVGGVGQPGSLLDSLGTIDRTNSFPEVPPVRRPDPPPVHPLAHSQAQDIMEADEAPVEFPSGKEPTINEGLDTLDPFKSATDGDDGSFFAKIGGLHSEIVTSPPDEEARFEEGLPLVPSETSFDRSIADPDGLSDQQVSSPALPDASNGGYQEETEITFSNESSFFRPQPLDRKSTTEVLDSLKCTSNGVNQTESDRNNPLEPHDNRDDLITLKSIEIPKSGIHDLGGTAEPNAEVTFFGQDQKHDDLAAIWQAALGDDELLDEVETSVDPAVFFDDDGEGFLEDPEDTTPYQLQNQQSPSLGSMGQGFNNSDPGSRSATSSHHQYTPASLTQPPALSSTPHLPATGPTQQLPQANFGMSHSISARAGFNNALHQQSSHGSAPPPARPRMPQSTQSFADKSKGGYTSPYDLPMDVTRPKKRNYTQQIQAGPNSQFTANNMAPPRSSSMYARGTPSVDSPPPLPSVAGASPSPIVANALPPTLKPKSSFFEELPSIKPRPASSMGRAALGPQTNPPRQSPPQYDPSRPDPARSASSSSSMSQTYQLLPPERISPYANVASQEPATQPVPALNSRYSPAPASQQTVPPPRNRYASSPATGPRPPQQPQALPFQPRTSSPLATQSTSFPSSAEVQQQHRQPSIIENSHPLVFHQQSLAQEHRESPQSNRPSPPSTDSRYTPSSNSPPSSYSMPAHETSRIPPSGLPYSSNQEPPQSTSDDATMGPPRRSQTQSPSAMRSRPDLHPNAKIPYQRPASVNQTSYMDDATARSAATYQRERRRDQISPAVNYIRPTDGRENDHLERWKGCPVFVFGFGGTIVSSFPKQIPRYAAGQSVPMMKCSPGEVNIHTDKAFALEEGIVTFPGPLRSKNKKKEVLDWLQKRIHDLENAQLPIVQAATLPDPRKRHEEKIILWRVVQTLVEYDGAIEGNPTAEKAVWTILSPELSVGDDAKLPLSSSNAPLIGITRSRGSVSVPEPADPEALEGLRKILLHGGREKSVWYAVDRRLWGHAMLLASTLDKSIWKQVLQEFNTQEVKAYGDNTESLAALYQVFAGNWEESVDQLVPPSARAGLQMVSKASTAGPMKNALDGLDRWRETLTLVLSNRTQQDGNALLALGRLLAGYGRTEAAHICYIFARTPGLFGGPDDPQVSVALLGADHLQHPYDYSRDFDSILLTEVYDYARTVLAPSAVVTISPHLQSYKLYHALTLAEYGYRSEAQNYCDTITSALKSTTKLSPYYHTLLFGALEDLVQRLRQAPKDGSTSMIAGLSMDKVSGSVWSRLNQFIAGDESDAESTKSGNVHDPAAGPFARIAGDSPNISRPPSSNDLYGSYTPMGGIPSPQPPTMGSSSRYAPAGQYTPRSSLEQPNQPFQDFQRPAQPELLRPPLNQQLNSLDRSKSASTRLLQGQQQQDLYKPPIQHSINTPPTEIYLPTPPSQPQYMPNAPPDELSSSLHQQKPYQPSPSSEPEPYQPSPLLEPQPSQDSYQPGQNPRANNSYTPLTANEDPQTSSYNPGQSNYEPPGYGYEPPTYYPENQDGSGTPEELKSPKKKKSFMYGDDDDDDFSAKAAAVLKAQKAQKDREADEAFKKAAEADGSFPLPFPSLPFLIIYFPSTNATPLIAQKGPQLNAKKSWFGGWLSARRDSSELNQPAGNAPIKAKLGEKSSFYYDKDLKKWINGKGGDDAGAGGASSTPPPPRAPPPSRAVSGVGGPPPPTSVPPMPPLPGLVETPPTGLPPTSNLLTTSSPSRSDSPANTNGNNLAATTLAPPTVLGTSAPPSAPSSRPGTAMSNASTIDDLIGVPQARKGGTVKKAKKGRGYVDVMAK